MKIESVAIDREKMKSQTQYKTDPLLNDILSIEIHPIVEPFVSGIIEATTDRNGLIH
jgi:hypothetical protein